MMQDSNFWYQSPQEKNSALMEKLRERRKKQKKAKAGDMAHYRGCALGCRRVDRDCGTANCSFIYTPWFTALTLVCFRFHGVHICQRIGLRSASDTLEYYTFTDKSAADLAEFWILFFIMAFLS